MGEVSSNQVVHNDPGGIFINSLGGALVPNEHFRCGEFIPALRLDLVLLKVDGVVKAHQLQLQDVVTLVLSAPLARAFGLLLFIVDQEGLQLDVTVSYVEGVDVGNGGEELIHELEDQGL